MYTDAGQANNLVPSSLSSGGLYLASGTYSEGTIFGPGPAACASGVGCSSFGFSSPCCYGFHTVATGRSGGS